MKFSAAGIICGILIMFFLSMYIYGCMPASATNIQSIVDSANKTEDGRLLVQTFFKKYQNPTNDNLYALKKLADEITIRDIARAQTGDDSIKMKTEIELEKIQEAQNRVIDSLNSMPYPFLNISILESILILVGLSGLIVALNIFRIVR